MNKRLSISEWLLSPTIMMIWSTMTLLITLYLTKSAIGGFLLYFCLSSAIVTFLFLLQEEMRENKKFQNVLSGILVLASSFTLFLIWKLF